MTLRELIDYISIQGDGRIQTVNENGDVKIIYEWEFDLYIPEEIENMYVHYMWSDNNKLIIEVSNEKY